MRQVIERADELEPGCFDLCPELIAVGADMVQGPLGVTAFADTAAIEIDNHEATIRLQRIGDGSYGVGRVLKVVICVEDEGDINRIMRQFRIDLAAENRLDVRRAVALRVDGGMSASDWTMQSLADILGAPVDRPMIQETTALGAAWLAGMQAGVYPDQAEFSDTWALDQRFIPEMSVDDREAGYARWQRAVQAAMSYSEGGL